LKIGGTLYEAWEEFIEALVKKAQAWFSGSGGGGGDDDDDDGECGPGRWKCPCCGACNPDTTDTCSCGANKNTPPDQCPTKSGSLSVHLPKNTGTASVPTFADLLTGKHRPEPAQQGSNISIGNIHINVPPGDYDEAKLAAEIARQLEGQINGLARSQRMRGQPWGI